MLESDADRLAEIQALGNGATLAAQGGTGYSVVFDEQYLPVNDVEERGPVATMRSSDVAAAKLQKDAVVQVSVDGGVKAFRVKRFEPDGTGITLVYLRSA